MGAGEGIVEKKHRSLPGAGRGASGGSPPIGPPTSLRVGRAPRFGDRARRDCREGALYSPESAGSSRLACPEQKQPICHRTRHRELAPQPAKLIEQSIGRREPRSWFEGFSLLTHVSGRVSLVTRGIAIRRLGAPRATAPDGWRLRRAVAGAGHGSGIEPYLRLRRVPTWSQTRHPPVPRGRLRPTVSERGRNHAARRVLASSIGFERRRGAGP
jgi:hypothetical protein